MDSLFFLGFHTRLVLVKHDHKNLYEQQLNMRNQVEYSNYILVNLIHVECFLQIVGTHMEPEATMHSVDLSLSH